jgi:phosphopantothenoylcysteine decarboxylase/phosphopantothenate--cysteine ligase
VVNDVAAEGVGFDADLNAATFLTLSTANELPEMSKRSLADRILDEILTLRRPRSLVLEMSDHVDEKARQDQVRSEALPAAARRQLIIE